MTAAKRKRLTLVAGAPGSGKSEWLTHHLHYGVFRHARVMDMSKAQTARCACCGDTATVIASLREVYREAGDSQWLVLNLAASTDLASLANAIRRDSVLSEHLLVSETIFTVDAIEGLQNDPFLHRQVESADCLVVTKVDTATETQRARLLAEIRGINPRAALFGAVRGVETPLPEIATVDNHICL